MRTLIIGGTPFMGRRRTRDCSFEDRLVAQA